MDKPSTSSIEPLHIQLPDELVITGVPESMRTVTIDGEAIAAAQQNRSQIVDRVSEDDDTNIVDIDNNPDESLDLLHLDANGDLQSGDYTADEKKRIRENLKITQEEMANDPRQIQFQLNEDRNALASIGSQRRSETFMSKWTKKETAARYDTLRDKYKASLDKQLAILDVDQREDRAIIEAGMLSNAEEVFRSGDKEKIADLYNVNYDTYKQVIAEEFTKRDVAESKERAYDRTIDWVQGRTDKVVDRWGEMSGKKKLAVSAGISALAVGSAVVLPIGAVIGATGATGAGLFSTAKSALRKSVTYKLNSSAKHKKRQAIIGEVSTTDQDISDIKNSEDVLAILDSTIENDRKDNNKTLRRVGYAAVAGALLGGTIGKYGGQLIGFISDNTRDLIGNINTDGLSDAADDVEQAVDEVIQNRPNIPAIDADLPEYEVEDPVIEEDVVVPVPEVDPTDELDSESSDGIDTPADDTELEEADRVDGQSEIDPPQEVEVDAEVDDTGSEEVVIDEDVSEPEIETPVEEPAPVIETPAETVDTPEEMPVPETVSISPDGGDGFQSVLKDQYNLTDDQSWRAYLAIQPHLEDQSGVYSMGGGHFGISNPGEMQLNPQASAALRSFLDSLEDEDELLPATS